MNKRDTLKRGFVKIVNSFKKWPRVDVVVEDEPKFLFILTAPNSGSTVLSKLLNTAHNTMILHPRAEGQWLIPGMCEPDRWTPEKYIDWESVRSIWLSKYQLVNTHVETINLIIEKSPANLVRADQLRKHFENSRFFGLIRNPYANISSILYRYSNTEKLSREQRETTLLKATERWLFRAGYLKKYVLDFNMPYVTYEYFCSNPEESLDQLIVICPELSSVNIHAHIQIKDYKKQGIVNQNARQIGLLDSNDIATISSVLAQNKQILDFFDYEIMSMAKVETCK